MTAHYPGLAQQRVVAYQLCQSSRKVESLQAVATFHSPASCLPRFLDPVCAGDCCCKPVTADRLPVCCPQLPTFSVIKSSRMASARSDANSLSYPATPKFSEASASESVLMSRLHALEMQLANEKLRLKQAEEAVQELMSTQGSKH